ncbi:1,2-phenylacetyl-CoA epoxidase subunit PaaC [Candidatus Poriferisodalis sp.]|uniref:1,2-phenylacetyl-CoA epoxidase subunit PaaC n=1 Tax=Candidatus Poriferisodalis sp. TaxID=3101277 RepID=UPI003B02A1B2
MTTTPHSGADDGRREFVLAFADDELCIGQNLAWWIAVGPFLEEDLALTSISQDELGHARALYGLLGDDVERLAYGRQPQEYRSAHIAELPCRDWGETLVRHCLYDTAETVRWSALADSSWEALGAVARRALAEERSHVRHASGLVSRLLRTDAGRSRLLPLFEELAPMACELFDLPPGCSAQRLVAAGVMARSPGDQRAHWQATVDEALAPTGCRPSWPTRAGRPAAGSDATGPMSPGSALTGSDTTAGGRAGVRSPHFASLHAEMVEVLALDPSARW